jgi:hypothetical protein
MEKEFYVALSSFQFYRCCELNDRVSKYDFTYEIIVILEYFVIFCEVTLR